MSELTRNLRRIITGHDAIVPERILLSVLDELEAQDRRITDLAAEMRQQLQRCEDRETQLQKQIDRLKRVHGA